MIFLTFQDICEINRIWIDRYGGRYLSEDNNLCNKASLEYILNAIQYPIFGYDMFPTLIEKAAGLAWWIIEGHIFNDGNKRTGMQAAIELLEINGIDNYFTSEVVINIALFVAQGKMNLEQLAIEIAAYT